MLRITSLSHNNGSTQCKGGGSWDESLRSLTGIELYGVEWCNLALIKPKLNLYYHKSHITNLHIHHAARKSTTMSQQLQFIGTYSRMRRLRRSRGSWIGFATLIQLLSKRCCSRCKITITITGMRKQWYVICFRTIQKTVRTISRGYGEPANMTFEAFTMLEGFPANRACPTHGITFGFPDRRLSVL